MAKKTLLDHLVTETYVSGEDIAGEMGITRAAVAKQVKVLREKGYVIEASTKRGYRLVSCGDVLDAVTVQTLLTTKAIGRQYRFVDACDSTMRLAAEEAQRGCKHGAVVVADTQTAGKGRLGRTWESPKGTGLYFSLVLRPDMALAEISKLTLVVGAAVIEAMQALGLHDVRIKWPNDVFLADKKVCGILTELSAQPEHIEHVIVGLGINVATPASVLPETATSIFVHSGNAIPRAKVLAAVLSAIETRYDRFVQGDFESSRAVLNARAYLADSRVAVTMPKDSFEGTALEVAADGALLVKDDAGTVRRVISADVTRVRKEQI